MPKVIAAFQKEHPFVQVKLVETSNEEQRIKLLNHEIDLVITNFTEDIPGVTMQDFYDEENVLLISENLLDNIYGRDKEKVLEQVNLLGHIYPLKDCPFVLMNSDNIAGRIGRNILNAAGFTADVKVTSDNIETLLSLCIDDCGACFCPELLVRRALTPETMVKLRVIRLGEDAKYKIRFGYAKQNYQWHAIDEFINIAVKSLNDKALQAKEKLTSFEVS